MMGNDAAFDRIRQAVASHRVARLGEIAVERGMIAREQLSRCANSGRPLDEALVTGGLLTAEQVAELGREALRRDVADLAQAPEGIPEAVRRAQAEPERTFDRYVLVEPIGRGAMGRIWKAWDLGLHRWVALKVMHEGVSANLSSRFVREGQAAARLRHPNLVTVHDVGEHAGRPYLVMEFIEGRALDLKRPLKETVAALATVARALDEAHRAGIVHRDLKPDNVLVDTQGGPHVVDFGLAHVTDSDMRLTRSGVALGTPLYMAPEQVAGRADAIGPATDVYALGVLLYEALAKVVPHTGRTVSEVYERILREDPKVPPGPPELVSVCLKSLEKAPQNRYATAGALADDLERYLLGEPVSARRRGVLHRLSRRLARHRVALLALGSLVALLGAGVWAAARLREADSYRRLHERLRPLEDGVKETRAFFYIRDINVREKLAKLEQFAAQIDGLARDPQFAAYPDAWALLGIARYWLGDLDGAETALHRAESLGSKDSWVPYYRARICLDRSTLASITALSVPDDRWREESLRWVERASQHLRRCSDPLPGADPLHQHLPRVYKAAIASDADLLRRLCDEGLERWPQEMGAEEFWLYRALVETDTDRRIADYGKALDRRPHYPLGHLMRAFEYSRRKEVNRAIEDATRAIEVNPRFALAYAVRANLRSGKSDHEAAIEDTSRAIELEPQCAYHYHNRGMSRARLKDHAAAIADFTRAIELDPALARAWHQRARSRRDSGDRAGAIADFTRAIDLGGGSYYERGYLYRELKEWERCEADMSEAIRVNPVHAESHYCRGDARVNQGRDAEALRDLREAARLKPDFTDAHYNRMVVAFRLKEWDELFDAADALLKVPAADAIAVADGHFYRAAARDKRGESPEAVLADFELALQKAPADWPRRADAERLRDQLRRH